MMHTLRPGSFASARRQSGVVLVVAMVMLVVIGLASVAIMRNAMNTDLVSDNTRRQNQSLQNAQAGLRFCEAQLVHGTLTPAAAVTNPDLEDWRNHANWTNTSAWAATDAKRVVDESFLKTSTTKEAPAHLPQCMAQFRTVGTNSVVVITSRGFSDNFTVDENSNRTIAGSEVWLQSIVQLGATDL